MKLIQINIEKQNRSNKDMFLMLATLFSNREIFFKIVIQIIQAISSSQYQNRLLILQIFQKTLRDYYSFIKKASYITDLDKCLQIKISYLRQLLQQEQKIKMRLPLLLFKRWKKEMFKMKVGII
ncbi:unnamed protein product [Paramecium sonneborni]|uniref:Uncharacterized protein n=1 Tax=Paramecium sonneborni TaxID=65129 RepID=A0A8S1KMT1_9CILI|nr:unnamed protein product [Paramecium sonneborni]